MKKSILNLLIVYISLFSIGYAQQSILKTASEDLSSRFLSNSVGDLIFYKNAFWISGSKGLSKSTDNGATWLNLYGIKEFTKPTIVSMDLKGDTIWASLVYTTHNDVSTGDGFTISTDGGKSWNHIDQVKDDRADSMITYGKNKLKALAVTVNEQNVTYSTFLNNTTVWLASWSSGIRKSTDLGKTFQRVLLPPDNLSSISPLDTLQFELNPKINDNHLGFSVYAVDSLEIWAGTAGGINRSTDGGISWKKFSSQSLTSPILGDWVIFINQQKLKNKNRIWITNWKTEDAKNDDYGVCYTENGGEKWTSLLKGTKANYIEFRDTIIYIGTDKGILRSDNDGKSFEMFQNIYDRRNNYKILNPQILSIAVKSDTVWLGTADGLVYTIDNDISKFGTEWYIQRAYQSSKPNESYAYPNPFSPNDESVRIHYKMPNSSSKISLDIFDFGMNHIKNILNGVTKSGSLDQEDIWNGTGKNSNRVPNGVYFYRLKIDDENIWGKILVLE
jgi:hypothetical protein